MGERSAMRRLVVITAMSVSLTCVLNLSPANAAAPFRQSCRAGGFTGFVSVHYNYTSNPHSVAIGYYRYRISKGTNQEGNQANVFVSDQGFLPTKN